MIRIRNTAFYFLTCCLILNFAKLCAKNNPARLMLHRLTSIFFFLGGGVKFLPKVLPLFRSFVPPVRDEEHEIQRKAHAKRVRETRRSTQVIYPKLNELCLQCSSRWGPAVNVMHN